MLLEPLTKADIERFNTPINETVIRDPSKPLTKADIERFNTAINEAVIHNRLKPLTKADIERFNTPIDETVIYDPLSLVTKAKGSKIWIDGEDEPYIDLLMSYSSTNFGHANDTIMSFVKDAAEKYDNVIAFNSSSKIELSKKLVELLPNPGNKIPYYPVGGTKAIEAALKMAKAYTKKDTIIAFSGAFHGYSYAAMTLSDDGYIEKSQFGTYPGKVKKFPFPHKLVANAEEISRKILEDIESYLKSNHNDVAAILFEPIQGAAGFIIPPDNFIKDLVELAKKYSIVSICDEIQTGVGRTGTFYYINQLNIDPDVVLLSKSLAGGYYPLSAVIANKELHYAVDAKLSGFDSTFATNLFGIHIANRVVDYIKEKDILATVQKTGKTISSELELIVKDFPFIRDFDSIGMAYGYRVEAPSGKIEDSSALAKRIKKEAFKNHLIIQTAGTNGDHMKMSPSFFISEDEIRFILKKLRKLFNSIGKSL
jgi:4-aminobutyrate aminotransferase/(S)-3-amino-2-methylpropionate transaminase